MYPTRTRTHRLLAAMLAATAVLLSSCGGDSSTDTPPATVSVGTITGFGSVIVNGVRFDDSGASVTIDDAAATSAQLRVGMVVAIDGSVSACPNADTAVCEGVATRIRFRNNLVGPITTINRLQNTITVMGRTVAIDDSTTLDSVPGNAVDGLAVGDVVAVSGLEDRFRNQLRARWMERRGTFVDGTTVLQVDGSVAGLDTAASRFTLDGLTVDYAGACAAAAPGNALANGQGVVVVGRSLGDGVFLCDQIRLRDRISVPDASLTEVEGYVANFVSAADFEIDGQKVDASASTVVFRNGTVADLANGVKVEVEGLMSGSVLLARKVTFKLEALSQAQVQFEAPLQAVDLAAPHIVVLGQTVVVDPLTEFKDQSAAAVRTLKLSDLAVGDRLDVRAYPDATGRLVASRIERTAADDLLIVKGPLDAFVAPTALTIVGVPVTTAAATRYRDADGNLVTQDAFYATLQVPPALPTRLRAQGVAGSGDGIDATRAVSTTGEVEVAD